MKTRTLTLAIALLISMGAFFGCKRTGCTDANACNYDEKAKTNDGSCINKGQVTYWKSSAGSNFDIVVTVNGTEATVTTGKSVTPLCDASGCATFALCPGSHNWSAHEVLPGVGTWSGNAVASEDGCLTVLLE